MIHKALAGFVVHCDTPRCPAEYSDNCRLEFLNIMLQNHGWNTDDDKQFCPACSRRQALEIENAHRRVMNMPPKREGEDTIEQLYRYSERSSEREGEDTIAMCYRFHKEHPPWYEV